MSGQVWCIVVAAGSGRRYGAAKQFEELDGRRVVDRSVDVARQVCDGVVVVVSSDSGSLVPDADVTVTGGDSRAASVRAGLDALPAGAQVVLVHDAARPLATADLFRRVVTAVRAGASAAVPVVAVTDTIREIDGGVVDRDRLRAVQTPQGFPVDVLQAAHVGARDATDDATLVERAGGTVVLVDGEPTNIKITGPHDRVIAEALLAARGARGGDSGS